jgi:serine/threonine protein kinase
MDKLLKKLNQALPEYIVGKVAVATVRALHYLKESHGVIHRDVKPSNILLDDKGNVKLCDFGISGRLVDSKAKTRTAGCTAYMAPERIDPPDPSRPNYDIRADVWSLGITLVELATGKFPYGDCVTEFEVMTRILDNESPKLPKDRNYSPEFHSFIKYCLVKNYKERPKYKYLLEHTFIKNSDAKPIDIRTWYNIVCGSSTPSTILANRQLQSPSAASLNNYYLPGSGSSSVGRHSSRLRSSPSPSSSSLMSIVTPIVPHPTNHQHRLGSAGSSTSSSSGYYSSMISPRTPNRTTPSPMSGKPSRYEEFALPAPGGSGRPNPTQHYQPQNFPHRTAFDRLNSEPLPNVRSPQTPHSPNPNYTVQPPDPPPRMSRLGSSESNSSTPTSSSFNGGHNVPFMMRSATVTNTYGDRSSSPMSPNDMVFTKVQKEGKDLVPNIEFWEELPSLWKDGVNFIVVKIKNR